MPTYTRFKNIGSIQDLGITDQLIPNLTSFIDWGLLNADGFFNVSVGGSGAYVTDNSRLRPVQDRAFTQGRVWEGHRINWVWESGLEGSYQPIRVTGVHVNSVFYPSSTTGTNSHFVDYPNGRIIFNNAISTGSVVKAAFSYKWAKITDFENPLFQQALHRAYRTDDNYLNFGSGDRNLLGQARFEFPVVAIEIAPRQRRSPYQIGGGEWIYQDVNFHILAEKKPDRNKLIDILAPQTDKTIYLYDINKIADSGRYPLNVNGSLASGALCYPALVEGQDVGGFRWRKATFENTEGKQFNQVNTNLWYGIVQTTLKIDLPFAY
jgi:hypothetical protein